MEDLIPTVSASAPGLSHSSDEYSKLSNLALSHSLALTVHIPSSHKEPVKSESCSVTVSAVTALLSPASPSAVSSAKTLIPSPSPSCETVSIAAIAILVILTIVFFFIHTLLLNNRLFISCF